MAGAGSFIGGVARYLLSQIIHSKISTVFPVGTFAVNMIGCLLIGLLIALAEKNNLSEEWKIFFTVGILGGFTTFSAFSLESIQLIRNGEQGMAALYILLSVVLGLLSTFIGYNGMISIMTTRS